ncbi:MAG: thioredoxin family protein [Planctomycetota bacterium]
MPTTRLPFTAVLAAVCLITMPALAAKKGWTEDYDAAKTKAGEQSKDLLLEFTGSDWCPPCKKLNEMVFSHDSFASGAGEHFVLVKLDFPRSKEQSADLKKQNRELQQKYGIRGYPTVMLTDAEGRPYAQTGFRQGGPEDYIAHLEELKKVRVERDKHFTAAQAAEGIDKAKHLHEGLEVLGSEMALTHYGATVEQIIELDSDNEAGLKQKYNDLYAAKKIEKEIESIMQGARNDPEGAVAKLDEVLARDGLSTASKQTVLTMKSQVQMFVLNDKETAKATLTAAIEADPESEMAEQLRGAMKRFFGDEGGTQ